ncbi:MAG: hypothetical protein ACYC1L_16760 [Alphaproteobacteria bacterium]
MKTGMRARVAAGLVAMLPCFGLPAAAAEMQPLEAWAVTPEATQQPTYAPIRCAGLYLGLVGYGGKSLSPQTLDGIVKSSTVLTVSAMQMRAGKDGNPRDYSDAVLQEAKDESKRYETRMKQNFDTTGKAFQNDPVIGSDLKFCRELTGRLATAP